MDVIRVVLAEDNALLREGISRLVALERAEAAEQIKSLVAKCMEAAL